MDGLLARHTGCRRGRLHDGKVGDALEPASVVRCFRDCLLERGIARIVLIIDAHDIIDVHDGKCSPGTHGRCRHQRFYGARSDVRGGERRFAMSQAPHAVEWLSDNGSFPLRTGRHLTSLLPSA